MKRKLYGWLVFTFICLTGVSQASEDDQSEITTGFLVEANYSLQLPAADLSKRFGMNSDIGGSLSYVYDRWQFGLAGDFLFGRNVKENGILDSLLDEDGFLVSELGREVPVGLFERGLMVRGEVGRLFPLGKAGSNSGLIAKLGVGYMQHRILIDANSNDLPQLKDDYKSGYDRLSSGLVISEYFGYRFISDNQFLNFSLGLEMHQAFTKNQRAVNLDTNTSETESRLDLLFGIKLGWIIPIFNQEERERVYY